MEAYKANCAPPVILEATNEKALDIIDLKYLLENSHSHDESHKGLIIYSLKFSEAVLKRYSAIFLLITLSFGKDLKKGEKQYVSEIDSIYFKLDPIDVTGFRKSYLNPISETLISGDRIETFKVSSSFNTVLRNVPGFLLLAISIMRKILEYQYGDLEPDRTLE